MLLGLFYNWSVGLAICFLVVLPAADAASSMSGSSVPDAGENSSSALSKSEGGERLQIPTQSQSQSAKSAKSDGGQRLNAQSTGAPDIDPYFKSMLTPSAVELAEITSVLPLMNRLRKEQQVRIDPSLSQNGGARPGAESTARTGVGVSSTSAGSSLAAAVGLPVSAGEISLERVVSNQRIVYLRTKINAFMQTSVLEVNSVIGELNSGLAELADRKAMISDQRARTLRRTTFINLVSGGLTKIGGYSIALTPATLIPTNILEIFDGTVQTSLSIFTLRQQKQEAKLSKARPDILNAFLSGNNMDNHEFPATVWTFLNRVPPLSKDDKTRREALIDRWYKIGRLNEFTKPKDSKLPYSNLISSIGSNFKLDELDDTVAMTSDLKSVVSTMQTGMMELGESFRESYKEDPEI